MTKSIFWLFIFFLLGSFVSQDEVYPPLKNDNFKRGEVLHYKMSYGIFTIGKASVNIHPEYFTMSDRQCFKVDVYGKTVGMVDWVANVDDQWGAYIDTASLIPLQFFRKQREGNYKKDEWTNFDQVKNKIEVKTLDHKTGKLKDPQYYDAPAQVRDMISGFLLLRTIDFSKIKVRDTLTISGFFEDAFYRMRIIYKGRENIRSKVGKIRTLVLVPVMPDNKIFNGENSVTVWISDDKNKVPVKVDAEMFIGSAGVELTSYSGLRNPLNLVER